VNLTRTPIRPLLTGLMVVVGFPFLACEAGPDGGTVATPPIVAGSSGAPREVNLITRDYSFVPDVLDLVPGETILLHVINGGLVVHEAVIGDASVQDAWEAAEAAVAGAPPGPTPMVTVPADVAGVRVVVASGERVDLTWTVPADAVASGSGSPAGVATSAWLVGCHIPGHWARGMQIPVRWVSQPAATAAPAASAATAGARSSRPHAMTTR
jgi:uncharacterized cupredoxin-like copper-binding protein